MNSFALCKMTGRNEFEGGARAERGRSAGGARAERGRHHASRPPCPARDPEHQHVRYLNQMSGATPSSFASGIRDFDGLDFEITHRTHRTGGEASPDGGGLLCRARLAPCVALAPASGRRFIARSPLSQGAGVEILPPAQGRRDRSVPTRFKCLRTD